MCIQVCVYGCVNIGVCVEVRLIGVEGGGFEVAVGGFSLYM